MNEYVVPKDELAERMILGSLLSGKADFSLIRDSLSQDDFFSNRHGLIWKHAAEVYLKGLAVDRITVFQSLHQAGEAQSAGGLDFLVEIDIGLPLMVNLDSYVSIVRDKSTLRRAIKYHQLAIEECCYSVDPTAELLQRAERSLADITTQSRPIGDLRSVLECVVASGGPNVFTRPDTHTRGLKTPWPRLNQYLEGGGLLPAQMVTIGARPSLGKTALGCQVAIKIATDGLCAAYISLEMTSRAIVARMLCGRAQVDSIAHFQGRTHEFERHAMEDALLEMTEKAKLWIASKCYTLPSIRMELLRLSAKEKISIVVVDYLQLMEPTGSSGRNRTEQISELSRGLKRIAEEFQCAVLVLSQLNRDMDRENRPPRLSDLRDGGSVEQDSDVVLLPHRLPDQREDADDVNVDLIIAKQRNGALGRVPMVFHRKYTHFMER